MKRIPMLGVNGFIGHPLSRRILASATNRSGWSVGMARALASIFVAYRLHVADARALVD